MPEETPIGPVTVGGMSVPGTTIHVSQTDLAKIQFVTGNNTNTTTALVAAVTAEDGTVLPERWHAYLVVEGLRTTDHRMFRAGSLIWRDLPLALEWNDEGNDHWDSQIVGSITNIERQDGGWIYAEGTFDLGSDVGREAARLNKLGMLRWVSIDAEVLESELIEIGAPAYADDDWDFWQNQNHRTFDLDYDWYEEYTSARIAGVHMVTIPAFPQAVIVPSDVELTKVEPMGEAPQVDQSGLLACAAVGAPPAAWFGDQHLPGPTPLTILDNGQVFTHIALWGTCHTGIPDACVCPPRSQTNYAHATTGGTVKTAEGTLVRVGHLTIGTGHAGLNLDHRTAAAHYDNTGACVIDWVYGEDDYGIWAAGALHAGVTEEQVRAVRASTPSGDWRDIGGNLELVACLAVNVGGFPILQLAASGGRGVPTSAPRAGLAYDDGKPRQVSLVAAGVARRDPLGPMRAQLTALQVEVAALGAVVRPLLPAALAALAQRVGG